MSFFKEVRKLVFDCLTNTHGNYDPARVVGYIVVVLASLEFMVLSAYVTIKDGKFDGSMYAIGLASISTALIAAAAGVWMKKSTEMPSPTKTSLLEDK